MEEPPEVKWNRGLDLFIESVHKPDHELRQCAHNQKCYYELMEVREHVLEDLLRLVYRIRSSGILHRNG
ncbi:MAG: Synechococcus phage Syn19 [Cyanobacteriota bacterium]